MHYDLVVNLVKNVIVCPIKDLKSAFLPRVIENYPQIAEIKEKNDPGNT